MLLLHVRVEHKAWNSPSSVSICLRSLMFKTVFLELDNRWGKIILCSFSSTYHLSKAKSHFSPCPDHVALRWGLGCRGSCTDKWSVWAKWPLKGRFSHFKQQAMKYVLEWLPNLWLRRLNASIYPLIIFFKLHYMNSVVHMLISCLITLADVNVAFLLKICASQSRIFAIF